MMYECDEVYNSYILFNVLIIFRIFDYSQLFLKFTIKNHNLTYSLLY